MNKLKVVLFGVTHEHADGKINTLRLCSDTFDVLGVFDDMQSATTAKFPSNPAAFDGIVRLTEAEALDSGADLAFVEVPNNELVDMGLKCAERGLPMHLDKPPTENLENFGKLLSVCKRKTLALQMGYMFRGNPAFNFCRRIIHEGWLGEIFEFEADMNHNYGGDAYQDYLANFHGGIMFNLGCHLIDYIVSVMGAPEAVTSFLGSTSDVSPKVKNNCLAVLKYPYATAVVRVCDKNSGNNRRRLKFTGTKGWIELVPMERFDGNPLTMKLALDEPHGEYSAGVHTINFGTVRDRYEAQLRELAKIIRGEMSNPYTYEFDFLVHKVVMAAGGYRPWEELRNLPFPEDLC